MKKVETSILSFIAIGLIFTSCGNESSTATIKAEEVKTEISNKVEAPASAESIVADGKSIFDAKCVACHKVDEKLIGPALKDVTERRSDEWILKMIVDPANMLATDAEAKKLLVEYKNVPMVGMNVTEADAHKVLEYLKSVK